MIKKILVPIDGSETADKALDFALDLAEKYSAHIVLLTVVVPPVSTSVAIDDYLEELHSRHEDILSESVKKAKEKRDFEVFTELKEGRPARKIVETVQQEGFDIIVMGSRGLGGIKKFLLGSVSDRVADQAPCPVLIVK